MPSKLETDLVGVRKATDAARRRTLALVRAQGQIQGVATVSGVDEAGAKALEKELTQLRLL